MKRLLFLIFAIIPYIGHSEVYFKEGMKWINEVQGSDRPMPPPTYETYYIRGTSVVDDMEVLNMYVTTDHEPEEKFVAYIRVEGEKVFFKHDDSENAQWYLMYDFGLLPGEKVQIFSPFFPISWYEDDSYVLCTDISQNEDYPRWESMSIVQFNDGIEYDDGGIWLKNLCSLNGVVYNTYGYVGGGTLLVEVYDNDELIFSKPGYNSVQDVTSDIKMTDEIYNLQGVPMGSDVNALSPGIYIINGKKVVIH